MMITTKSKSEQAVNAGAQGVRVATYTEKSFCVFGDTYPLRTEAELIAIGEQRRAESEQRKDN